MNRELFLSGEILAFTDADRWRPGIGDPTFMGWITVIAYFVTAYLCWRASRSGLINRRVKWFWTGLTALLVFLGFNKQLDLQTALTFIGRDMAKSEGWYSHRRVVQGIFVAVIGLGGIAGCAGLFYVFRRELKRLWQALAGVAFLVCFIVIRAASFHHVDQFLTSGPVRMNWILELGSIAAIAWPAWRSLKSGSDTSFVWISGGGARGPDAPVRVRR
jgi:hypothetical protein